MIRRHATDPNRHRTAKKDSERRKLRPTREVPRSFRMNVAHWSARVAGWFVLAGTAWAQTTRSSVDSSGVEGNDDSLNPQISADGRFVAFVSLATNLVA